METTDTSPSHSHDSVASVHLVGRLGNRIEALVLPSGDELVTFTVVVDRPLSARSRAPGNPGPSVDAIACRTQRAPLRRRVLSLAPGTWVEAEGTLRRRFWSGPAGRSSATEVEVTRLIRTRPAVRA